MNNTETAHKVLDDIKGLVIEEQTLHANESMDDRSRARLQDVKSELDQCWDLLRQRRALEDFELGTADVKVRAEGSL